VVLAMRNFMQPPLMRLLSKQRAMKMFQQKDAAHLTTMNEMQELMKNSEAMKEWFENEKNEFEALLEE
jgi:hypothetical protein